MTSIFLYEATEKNLWLLSSLKCHFSGLVDSAFKLTVTATRAAVAELLYPYIFVYFIFCLLYFPFILTTT